MLVFDRSYRLIDRWKPGDLPLVCYTPQRALADLPAAEAWVKALKKKLRSWSPGDPPVPLSDAEMEVYYLKRRAYPGKALADARAADRDHDVRELHVALNRTLQAAHVTGDPEWLLVHHKIGAMVAKHRKNGAPSYFREED